MAEFTFEALDQEACAGIPHANALVEGASGDITVVWRDGNSGDSIVDEKLKHLLVSLNVPKTDSAIAASRGDQTTIASKIERIDILIMPRELMLNRPRPYVPHLRKH